MRKRVRTIFYLLGAAVAGAVLLSGAMQLPAFGSTAGAYAAMLLRVGVLERHSVNIPTAVNFDYRGFDTLGEEFILFTALAGVLLIFSELHEASPQHAEVMEHSDRYRRTGAVRWAATGLVALIAAMGMSLAVHGTVTPGGGFQGGAVFGSAFLCIYLGAGYKTFSSTCKKPLFDAMEALGAAAYSLVGVAAAFAGGAFLRNVLALGKAGGLVSGGTIYLVNLCVFIEVGAGFVLLLIAYLHQTHEREEPSE